MELQGRGHHPAILYSMSPYPVTHCLPRKTSNKSTPPQEPFFVPPYAPHPAPGQGKKTEGPGQTAGQALPFLLCASVSLTAKWQQDQRLSQSLLSQSANIS